MRSVWSCASCFAVLITAIIPDVATASGGRYHEKIQARRVDRVNKLVVTTDVLEKRDAVCPPTASSCPSSLGGGCCQAGYACQTDACYATTTAPSTCAGNVGYFACGQEDGGKYRDYMRLRRDVLLITK